MKRKPKRENADKRTPQTIDGTTGQPIPPGVREPAEAQGERRRIDLSTLRDVRLEIAAVYRKVDAGELSAQEGCRRVYMLRNVADIITMSDWEKRIEDLEAARFSRAVGANQLSQRTH